MNNIFRSTKERPTSKKKTNPSRGSIFKFYFVKDTFKKKDVSPKKKLEDLGVLIVKKQFTYPICGKYVVQTFNFLSLSKIKLPF
jgi:hypothetical protein